MVRTYSPILELLLMVMIGTDCVQVSFMCIRQPSHVTSKEFITQLCSYQKVLDGHASVWLACVASVSNRVIARKLEREKKKVEGGGEKITCK